MCQGQLLTTSPSGARSSRSRLSLARHADRLADHRPLVLVHRPIHRPARPVGQETWPPPGAARLFGGLLKVWPVLIFLIPGMIGWALHQKGIIQLPLKIGRWRDRRAIDGDQVFPTLVKVLLPAGIRG